MEAPSDDVLFQMLVTLEREAASGEKFVADAEAMLEERRTRGDVESLELLRDRTRESSQRLREGAAFVRELRERLGRTVQLRPRR